MGVILLRGSAALQHTLPRLCEGPLFLPLCFWLSLPLPKTLSTRELQNGDSALRRDGRHRAAERPASDRQDIGTHWWDAKLVTYNSRGFASAVFSVECSPVCLAPVTGAAVFDRHFRIISDFHYPLRLRADAEGHGALHGTTVLAGRGTAARAVG